MTVLPNMSLTLPTQGAPGAGTWDDVLDANSALIDAHDHSTGKGTTVKTAGISINADLTFASLYAPINLHRLTFASIVALTSNNKSLFVSSADNELYWRSNAGANVKITAAGALNVAAFAGGIGGDYAAVSALADYDDATDTYRLRQETAASVRQFAKVQCADIKLIEYKASGVSPVPSNIVTLKSPAALAGSYSLIFPAALPGSTSLVQLDSAGALTASNTVANAVTLSSTLGVTGLITATAGVTAAANQHVTVSGTGRFKHGTRTMSVAAAALFVSSGAGGVGVSGYTSGAAAISVFAPVVLDVGKRVTAVRAFIVDNATGPTTLVATFISTTSTGGSATIATSATSAGNATNQTLSMTGLTTTVAASTSYSVRVVTSAGSAAVTVFMIEVDYDEP